MWDCGPMKVELWTRYSRACCIQIDSIKYASTVGRGYDSRCCITAFISADSCYDLNGSCESAHVDLSLQEFPQIFQIKVMVSHSARDS
jgi:hypothetical protein